MSPLRIEIEHSGVKAVLDGDTDVVQDLLKNPDQLDNLLGKLASISATMPRASKEQKAIVESGSGKAHSTRFVHWEQQNQIGEALHLALSEVGGEIEIVAPVKESSSSKMQEALGLLIGIKHFAISGDPKVPLKELTELCKKYGRYDSSNFSTHMRKRLSIFGSLRDDQWHLTPAGLDRAAALILSFAK